MYIKNSYFQIGWSDSDTEEHRKYEYLHSRYGLEEAVGFPVYDYIMKSQAANLLEGLTLVKAIANLSTPCDSYFIHTHAEKKVVLYYANIAWEDGWHGETLFFDDTKKNIKLASPYIPGRVIVFDGRIPHTIRPQSAIACKYRFTLALTFN